MGWGENYNPDATMSPNGRNAVEVHCFHSYHSLALAGRCGGRRTAGDGRNGGVVAGGLAEELRVGYSALIQPKVVGNDRVYVVVCRSRPQHGPRARAPERKKSGRKVYDKNRADATRCHTNATTTCRSRRRRRSRRRSRHRFRRLTFKCSRAAQLAPQ